MIYMGCHRLRRVLCKLTQPMPSADLSSWGEGKAMKLNPDTLRSILLKIEIEHMGPDWKWEISDRDYEQFYAATKLVEAGYIEVDNIGGTEHNEDFLVIKAMTVSGHQFLELIRDAKAWKYIKQGLKAARNASIKLILRYGEDYLLSRM